MLSSLTTQTTASSETPTIKRDGPTLCMCIKSDLVVKGDNIVQAFRPNSQVEKWCMFKAPEKVSLFILRPFANTNFIRFPPPKGGICPTDDYGIEAIRLGWH